MTYKEEYRDLFSAPDEYYFAQCISADFKMGAGIALQFTAKFDIKNKLISKYPDYFDDFARFDENGKNGDCIKYGGVLNLVTKVHYWEKPTLESMSGALMNMKRLTKLYHIHNIAMPQIGCGLDRLHWADVSKIIQDTFQDTDVNILVCKHKVSIQ
jgi:O-acetyl-ADP-ribose deacetylase (regulator of RNase III)